MKTKLFTIAMMVAFIMTAMMKVQAQNFEGPCLPSMHGLDDHQSAFCGSTVTQTIALVEDWNWFSTYIDKDPVELLGMLQDALGNNGIQIESLTDGVNENLGDGFWMGGLDDIGIVSEQMYMIQVAADCTIELEGPATNPAEHAITLNPGEWTWIGYPCSEEVDILVALAGLEAEVGDQIEDLQNGVAEYLGDGFWMGFETMVPGHGYMYYSNSTQPKTLVFSTTANGKSVSLRKHRE